MSRPVVLSEVHSDAAELYADVIEEFDRLAMPIDMRLAAIDIDEKAKLALDASQEVYKLRDSALTDSMLTGCYASEDPSDTIAAIDYLDEIEAGKELDRVGYKGLAAMAPHLLYMARLKIENDSRLMSAGEFNYTSLGFIYKHALAGDPKGSLKAIRSETVDLAADCILIADGISRDGRDYIDGHTIGRLSDQLIQHAAILLARPEAPIAITQEVASVRPLEVLQALVIVDIMALTKRLPGEYLAELVDAQEGDVLNPQQLATLQLLSNLHTPGGLRGAIELLFEEAPRDEAGVLVEPFGTLYERAMELSSAWSKLGAAQSAAEAINKIATDRYNTKIDVIGHDHHKTRHETGVAAGLLLQKAGVQFTENPTQDSMMRALSAENWLQAVFDRRISQDPRLAKDAPTDYRTLHHAIEKQKRTSQERELQTEIAAIRGRIEDIESQYEVSSRMVRKLEGGLELRRLLEDWVEPGSQRPLFTQDQAQQLAGLALQYRDNPTLADQ
ncbi:hypothetical protein KC973_02285, partial [Candidatus Saccharibacteria bacterium]|nr:hypothetical protein [Candidatus Saccharibacteria bacterium]